MPVNHQIIYHLQDVLNLLPDLKDSTTTQSFTSSTNDQLLVVYLSSLLRAVIALHALVDNKAIIGRVELEEGGSGDDKKDTDKDKDKKGDAKKEETKETEKEKEKEKEGSKPASDQT
jgi:26S proteasome regulatory subunit N8